MKRFKGTSLLYWTAISALKCAHLYLQQVNLLHFYYVQINFGSTPGFYHESKLFRSSPSDTCFLPKVTYVTMPAVLRIPRLKTAYVLQVVLHKQTWCDLAAFAICQVLYSLLTWCQCAGSIPATDRQRDPQGNPSPVLTGLSPAPGHRGHSQSTCEETTST